MKIRPVGSELFHADGQADMTKLRVAFRDIDGGRWNFVSHSDESRLLATLKLYWHVSKLLHWNCTDRKSFPICAEMVPCVATAEGFCGQ